jgi:hypothetical protein
MIGAREPPPTAGSPCRRRYSSTSRDLRRGSRRGMGGHGSDDNLHLARLRHAEHSEAQRADRLRNRASRSRPLPEIRAARKATARFRGRQARRRHHVLGGATQPCPASRSWRELTRVDALARFVTSACDGNGVTPRAESFRANGLAEKRVILPPSPPLLLPIGMRAKPFLGRTTPSPRGSPHTPFCIALDSLGTK